MHPNLLDELVFKPGQEKGKEDTIMLPLLTIKGLTHAIAMGPRTRNMAESFNFTGSDLLTIQTEFLTENGFADFTRSYISSVPHPDEVKLFDIEKENNTGMALNIPAEGMFTTLSKVPLIHKPADCPTAILLARDYMDQPVLGLLHLGRPQVNNHITEQALEHLETYYGVDAKTLIIGISPSIGPKYYFIRQKDQNEKNMLDLSYWGKYATQDELNQTHVIRIDVLGKILAILQEFGIPDKHIQAYSHTEAVDTFALAAQIPPLAFSHRYATSTQQPERNGRILVAAQLG